MDYGLAKLGGRYGTLKPPMTGSSRGTLMPRKKGQDKRLSKPYSKI
jgi:hypothetical protein